MSELSSSRRKFLKTGAALAAASPLVPGIAAAQTNDPELTRVKAARRLILRGAVVLTLDRAVGDFAAADVLIEDGKIRDIRPNIAAADAVTVDCTNRIMIPGFVDTHSHSYQGLLRSLLPNGIVDPDYNRDIRTI
jgi:imidazolonepropionase-like amidohydrolase